MLAKSLFAKRNFSTHLSRDKLTSFDYMWYDKLNFLKVGGWWYALLGVGNIMAYGLSHLMTKENYEYHFAYKGEGKMFNWIKSQVGCNTIDSVIWTAPSLILGNYFLMKRCGPIVATKLFATNLACVFMFQSSFHPNSGFAKRLIPECLMSGTVPLTTSTIWVQISWQEVFSTSWPSIIGTGSSLYLSWHLTYVIMDLKQDV